MTKQRKVESQKNHTKGMVKAPDVTSPTPPSLRSLVHLCSTQHHLKANDAPPDIPAKVT